MYCCFCFDDVIFTTQKWNCMESKSSSSWSQQHVWLVTIALFMYYFSFFAFSKALYMWRLQLCGLAVIWNFQCTCSERRPAELCETKGLTVQLQTILTSHAVKESGPTLGFWAALCTVSFAECQRALVSPLLSQLIDSMLFYLLSKKQRGCWCTVHERIYVFMSARPDVWLCILLITNIHRQAHIYPLWLNHSYSKMDTSSNRNAGIFYPSPKLLK